MSSDKVPVTIKKYANRRLYNTASSVYVTLEDLAAMVKRGSDFVVTDAKNGEDITRSVLAQIIFEQEGKHGQSLLPITFLRQLIRFYGSGMQMLVPSFLEMSLTNFAKEGGAFGQAFANAAFPRNPLSAAAQPMLEQMEEQTRRNMAMFRQAMAMFTPFPPAEARPASEPADGAAAEAAAAPDGAPLTPAARALDAQSPTAEPPGGSGRTDEVEEMRRQLGEMQRRLELLAGKGE